MSVVPLSSPLSSLGKNIDVDYENDSSSVSSLLLDYKLLNKIVQSNQFEKTLEIYSLMINNSNNNNNNNNSINDDKIICLNFLLNQLTKYYSDTVSEEWKQLNEIFGNECFRSFISSYDLILQNYKQLENSSSTVSFSLSDDENSIKQNQNSRKSEEAHITSVCSSSTQFIDEEKANSIYTSKLIEYNVSRLKIVNLEKRQGEPLGATICRLSDDDYRISIGRIIHGSICQGLLSVGDQLLEINNIRLQSEYRSLDDIVQLIDSLHGNISFVLLPSHVETHHGISNQAFLHQKDDYSATYVRSLFSYDPFDDMYIPCKELGLPFEKDSILEIVNQDDSSWWQAFTMEINENSRKEQFPGLIPSKQFQEKRLKIVKCLLDEETTHSKKKIKTKFRKTNSTSSTRQTILTTFSFGTYEQVEWFVPNDNRKRPIVLIGAPHIGRHELRQRLMNSNDLSSLIDVAVPHTTRTKKADEIDGRDYHFVTRPQFENDIARDLFVEYGEYEKNLYGTSKSAIETCSIALNKICILNLLPQGLDSLKYSNLFPFVIYLKIPSTVEKLREYFYVTDQQWIEIQEKTNLIEQNYSHLFDKTIYLNESFNSVFTQLQFLVKDVQTKSMWINQCWFSPRERF